MLNNNSNDNINPDKIISAASDIVIYGVIAYWLRYIIYGAMVVAFMAPFHIKDNKAKREYVEANRDQIIQYWEKVRHSKYNYRWVNFAKSTCEDRGGNLTITNHQRSCDKLMTMDDAIEHGILYHELSI